MRAFIVDAFTDAAFAGNPAGVVVLDTEPAESEWMQHVAAELRHSETAFVRARADGSYDLRWFTPTVEVDLCGHATLAAAHVLAEGATGTLLFHTRSGVLAATVSATGTVLDFPACPVAPVALPKALVEALGVAPLGVYSNGMDLLVELPDAAAVTAVRPDMALLRTVECRGVIVTAAADPGAGHDFVSRFFAPRVGVDEDPVTGSAHCALGPFWAERSGRTSLTGVQLSDRGGQVAVDVRGERVALAGSAITVLEGNLRV